MLARLLYRDGLMLVIDKPAGFAVHRGPKGGESLEDHFDVLRFGLPRRPALAHRLDRDTSGCLMLGRHHKALAQLGKLFKNGAIGKTYWAVVEGSPAYRVAVRDAIEAAVPGAVVTVPLLPPVAGAALRALELGGIKPTPELAAKLRDTLPIGCF